MISTEFVMAGKSIFTVENNNGKRYTFKVTYSPANGNFKPTWFISYLTGPDNENSYTYIGIVGTDGSIRLTSKSPPSESLPVAVARWTLDVIWGKKTMPISYKIQHAGRCGRCGRTLTVPESIESGIGPECSRQMITTI